MVPGITYNPQKSPSEIQIVDQAVSLWLFSLADSNEWCALTAGL
jgi:hypothetical protein